MKKIKFLHQKVDFKNHLVIVLVVNKSLYPRWD